LGAKPEPAAPPAFVPRAPAAYRHASGFAVWLDERHALPIVAMSFVCPRGAEHDAPGKAGTAFLAARMLTEGAGARDAIAFSQAVDAIGADLGATAYTDYSVVSVTTLKRHLAQAVELLGDAVVRPQFTAKDFQRAKNLWIDDLRGDQKEPKALFEIALTRNLFGPNDGYGHPRSGLLSDAPQVSLDDVRKAYDATFTSEACTLVASGDVDRAALDRVLGDGLRGFRANKAQASASTPPPRYEPPTGKVLVVDRPDAPQGIIGFVAPGVAAGSPEVLGLTRVNAALGGSFTSRLNQDLREERGLSYGASSRFGFTRRRGSFVASAAVFSQKGAEAIEALVADVAKYAQEGPSAEETEKTRLLARGDLLETFESVSGTSARLARNCGVGLLPDFETVSAPKRDAIPQSELKRLANAHLVPAQGFLLWVGPRAAAEQALPKLEGFGFRGPLLSVADAATAVPSRKVKR
jgi:predicted Zn-dependent peptidase